MAPEYPVITVDDNWNYSHHLDTTIESLKDLQTRYSVDPDRIYATGQSMGCMSSIVMMLWRASTSSPERCSWPANGIPN